MVDIIGTTLIATATGIIVGYLVATSLHQRRVEIVDEYIKGVCEECGKEVTYTRSTAKVLDAANAGGVKTTVTCSDCTEERMLNDAEQIP